VICIGRGVLVDEITNLKAPNLKEISTAKSQTSAFKDNFEIWKLELV